jgi:hypothetical protein
MYTWKATAVGYDAQSEAMVERKVPSCLWSFFEFELYMLAPYVVAVLGQL